MSDLTDQQEKFVLTLVSEGCSATEAARRAGYKEKNARVVASQLMRKSHVTDAIRREQARVLGTLGGKALKVIGDILDDADAPLGVRLDAAKTTLDRIGLVAARTPAHAVDRDERPLNEYSMEELHTLLGAIEAAKATQQAVTAEVNGARSRDWRRAATSEPGAPTIN